MCDVCKVCVRVLHTMIDIYGKGKSKVYPTTGHEDPEREERYSSTFSLTSVLNGGWSSTPRPGRFTPGKTRYSL